VLLGGSTVGGQCSMGFQPVFCSHVVDAFEGQLLMVRASHWFPPMNCVQGPHGGNLLCP
jgi:hypothetical protein